MEKLLMATKRNLISKHKNKYPTLRKSEKTKLLDMLCDYISSKRLQGAIPSLLENLKANNHLKLAPALKRELLGISAVL